MADLPEISGIDLLALMPELKDAMGLGTDVTIVVDGKALVIGLDIKKTPSKKKIKKFLD